MKIGIIVYSQTGNTYSVAQKLKEKLDAAGHEAQIEKVTTVGEVKPGTKEIQFETAPRLESYDGLVFAAPVHAFSLAPAMDAYLRQISLLGERKVACFVTKMLPFNWTGGTRAIGQMEKICQTKGADVCGSAIIGWGKGKRDLSIAEAVEKMSRIF